VLPSSNQERVGVLVCVFWKFSPGPPIPLSTLRATPRDVTCKTEGQDGVAVSFLVGLFHSPQHAGLTRRSLTNAVTEKSFQVSQYPIDDREQDLAAPASFFQNVPLGLQKTCIDRLGRRIN
jgi:hypothetical protein